MQETPIITTGAELKAARAKLGFSQEKLGREINLTRVMIGLMERGKKRVDRRTALAVGHLFCMQRTSEE